MSGKHIQKSFLVNRSGGAAFSSDDSDDSDGSTKAFDKEPRSGREAKFTHSLVDHDTEKDAVHSDGGHPAPERVSHQPYAAGYPQQPYAAGYPQQPYAAGYPQQPYAAGYPQQPYAAGYPQQPYAAGYPQQPYAAGYPQQTFGGGHYGAPQ